MKQLSLSLNPTLSHYSGSILPSNSPRSPNRFLPSLTCNTSLYTSLSFIPTLSHYSSSILPLNSLPSLTRLHSIIDTQTHLSPNRLPLPTLSSIPLRHINHRQAPRNNSLHLLNTHFQHLMIPHMNTVVQSLSFPTRPATTFRRRTIL